MSRHRVLQGVVVTTPEAVFEHYRPHAQRISPDIWETIRPVAVRAVAASDYRSVSAALEALRHTAGFVAWAHRRDMALHVESLFLPEHVEHFVATETRHLSEPARATCRSFLRRVGRNATKKAAWPPATAPYGKGSHMTPPYSQEEVEGFWAASRSQKDERRTRVLTALLALGLGAGLKPSEVLTVSAEEHIRRHPEDERLLGILLPDRTIPVLQQYVPVLRDLCEDYPHGALVGPHNPLSKDPLTVIRKGVEIPAWLPPLRVPRLRTTWMASVLTQDVRISEFLAISGTVSAKSLETIAPHVPGRWDDDAYLFKGAGL